MIKNRKIVGYATNYGLTKGIFTVYDDNINSTTSNDLFVTKVFSPDQRSVMILYTNKTFFDTLEGAEANIECQRIKKIKSLEKKILKLSNYSPKIIK